MSGLNSIYLANSFFKGVLAKIDCDGSCNCSGDNGAGKTTTLQLIPAFYGINPETMIKGDKDSFLDHYLPTTGSLLVFQYLREDGPCCALMYRHSAGSRMAYRFIKGHADDILFSEPWLSKFKAGNPVTDTFNEMRSQGIEISNQLTQINEYRAVIQQDRKLIKQLTGKGAALLHMARNYAVGGADGPMTQMDHLTFAVLKRNKMFGRMKDMIVATQFNSHVPNRPKHIDNQRIADDLASLRDFSTQQVSLKKCVNKHRERLNNETNIHIMACQLKGTRPELDLEENKLTTELDRIQENKTQAADSYQHQLSQYSEQLTTKQGTIRSLSKQADDINKTKDDWDEQDIAQQQADFVQLSTYEEQHEAAAEHLKILTEKAADQTNWRDKQLLSLTESIQKQRTPLEVAKLALDDEANEINKMYEQELVRIDKVLSEKKEQAFKQHAPARDDLRSKYDIEATRAKEGGETAEESLRLGVAEHSLQETEIDRDHQELQLESAEKKQEELRSKSQSAIRALDNALMKETACSKQVDAVRQQLFPEGNSLLAFLRKDIPNWRDSIGKIISPELLTRKDLFPDIDAFPSESIYGLTIDLGALDVPDYAQDEDRLRSRLNEAEERFATAQNMREEKEKASEHCQNSEQQAQLSLVDQKAALKRARSKVEVARAHVRSVKNNIKDAVAERRLQAKARTEAFSKSLEQLENCYKDQVQSLEESASESRSEALSKKGIDISNVDQKIEVNAKQLEQIKQSGISRRKDIGASYKARCKNAGVDEEVIFDAEKRLRKAKTDRDQVRGYSETVTKYKAWVTVQWARLPEILVQLGQTRDEFSTAEAAKQQVTNAYKGKMDSYKRIEQEQLSKLTVIKSRIAEIEDALKQVGAFVANETYIAPDDIELTIKLLRERLTDQNILKKEVLQLIQKANNDLLKRADSQISEAWSMLYARRLESLRMNRADISESDIIFLLHLPEELDELLTLRVPEIKKALITTVRVLGDQINNYYRDLSQLDREITNVSKKLKDQINTGQKIPTLSEIEIRLVSKVASVGAWTQLKAFNQEWEAWDLMQREELPPNSLEAALSDVVVVLDASHAHHDLASLLEMEIALLENSKPRSIRSDDALNNASSNGLSYLAVIVIFIGMSRYLCPNPNVRLTWPVDELATLAPRNVALLFSMLEEHNIVMFAAMPSSDANLLRHFNKRVLLDKDKGVSTIASSLAVTSKFRAKLASLKEEAL